METYEANEMGSGLSYALAIAKKDLVTQMRKRFEAFSMFLFAIIAVFVLGLVLSSATFIVPDPDTRLIVMTEIGAGMLWVVVFFTGMFGFSPVFISESETGTLKGLSLAPIPAWSIYLGKVIYGFILMGLVELFLVPISMGLLGFTFAADVSPIFILATFCLGTLDLAAVGAMASALTMPAESKATVYPIVYFPTATTALILLVEITRMLAIGIPLVGPGIFELLVILSGHVFAMVTLSATVFHFTLTS
ncbi:MAG: heme exporter protein CcmB [Candidatus Thorarchaeota archaeon]|jgi:heme exporter protein CcmB